MIKHYIKIAFRNFKRNPLIFGGSIMTIVLCALCVSLLSSYIHNEMTMDNFHKREKDIYLMMTQQSLESLPEAVDAKLFFNFDYTKYPEIDKFVAIRKYQEGQLKFKYDETTYSPEGIITDSTFFEIFNFNLVIGDKTTILSDPNALILSEKCVRKIFGNANPIGKKVKISAYEEKLYTVKGIVQSPPSNSSLTFDFILPLGSMSFARSGCNFIMVNKTFNPDNFTEKIKDIGHSHSQFKNSKTSVMPLSVVYTEGKGLDLNEVFTKFADTESLNSLLVIIVLILIISILNFSNLQIININSLLKNIGINKISGAELTHIFYQRIVELFILIFFSTILAAIAFILVLPAFNQLTAVELNLGFGSVILLNLTVMILIISIAMIYPSVILWRVSIKNSLNYQAFAHTKLLGRKLVSTIQFALSFVLLIASIVVVKQLDLMLSKDLGFSSENIISTQIFQDKRYIGSQEEKRAKRETAKNNYQYVKDELRSHSTIKNYAQGQIPIKTGKMPWKLKGGEGDYKTGNILGVDLEYANLFGLTIIEGRFFERGKDKSRQDKVVINEAAKKAFGIEDISKAELLNKYWSMNNKGYKVIGVVKDFNYEHLSHKPEPLMMVFHEDMESDFLIQFEDGAEQAGLAYVQQLFSKCNPTEAFRYSFLSDEIQALYQKEKRLSHIYILLTIIAFIISATGLFAIALYDTRKRTKEIGIRKVNGATMAEILLLLNKDFIKWVAIAFVVACPIAYYAMSKWLENFAYKTELSWWIFALAGVLALGIALLTVSFQSWKAAQRNPVESLRDE